MWRRIEPIYIGVALPLLFLFFVVLVSKGSLPDFKPENVIATLAFLVAVAALANQSRTARHQLRAYVQAMPHDLKSVRAMDGGRHIIATQIKIKNIGKTLATNVQVTTNAAVDDTLDRTDFPDGLTVNIPSLFPDMHLRPLGPELALTSKRFLIIWGVIRYDDGFGRRRTTRFCHGYQGADLRRVEGDLLHSLPATTARYMIAGNYAD